jgi:hypothetical protein
MHDSGAHLRVHKLNRASLQELADIVASHQHTMASPTSESELFPETLNLEDQFFTEGFALGVADGQKSGRIEGRIFGLENGFSKAREMGRLHGKSCVWEARLQPASSAESKLYPLADNSRLRKHILRLAALSDPEDLSVENNEDDVSEFDDRLKDAKAKAVIIERIVGQGEQGVEADEAVASNAASTQRKAPVRVKRAEKVAVAGKATGEMEDFVGRKGLGGS